MRYKSVTVRSILGILTLTAVGVASFNGMHTQYSDQAIGFTTACSVFSNKSCHVVVSLDGSVLSETHMRFTRPNGQSAWLVEIGADANGVTVSDGMGHPPFRVACNKATILTWSVRAKGVNCSSGNWTIRAASEHPKIVRVDIEAEEASGV
jgi:hypothetical protein